MPTNPEPTPKILTLAEANAALPKIRQFIERLQQLQREILDGEQRRGELTEQIATGNGQSRTALQDQRHAGTARHDQLMAEAESTFAQLMALGAMVKDLETGLVDFFGKREDEVVLLCWRLGEEMRIQHWHTLEGGFAGRRPVDGLIK